ncbi:MAG: sensor histidine kinase [Desulfobulbaceae bacterium]|nr:MAG: sensor histidine kinase [Desulfobulbaceae bacterium]
MKTQSPELVALVYQYVMQQADLLLIMLSADAKVKYVNNSVEKLAGSSPVGKSFDELILNFHGSLRLDKMADDGQVHLLNVVNASGLPLTYYFRFTRFEDKVIAIGQQDADEIDAMRRNLVDLNNELNNLTRELHKKNAELEKLNIQKNQFFGMASHDLRHPLGVISMYATFLNDEIGTSLSPTHHNFLEFIRNASTLMESILNDFLDYSIFESGKLELKCSSFELNGFIEKLSEYTQHLAQQKNGRLLFTPSPTPIKVYGDEAKIEQVINNLTSNGLKFSTSEPEIQITVEAEEGKAIIHVSDNGIGIDEEHVPILFKPFNTLHAKVPAGEKSSGLGLAIVKKIVEAHGGEIWVTSSPGNGATFSFSLPSS